MLKSCARAHSRANLTLDVERIAYLGTYRSFLRKVCALLFTTISLAACGAVGNTATNADLLGLELEGGHTIKQFSSDSALNIVMLMGSSECLSCSNDLNRWVEVAREHFGHATLILTSKPPAVVRDALIRLRLPYATVRQRDEKRALNLVPAIIVFRRGESLLMESRIAQNRRAFLVDSGRRLLSDGGKSAR